ncbi:esterase/lipase family protein [Halioxenophilus sp. WMMB6]|uniref:esterase/lipase family protein n=1 Tax=Halioxenophilus sp. WMMB6 TaxID=3073815 RepID=UPI00295E2D67|nr:alpha/beta fold hydrolase [Halioxenophilus sp. WMMB6]
MSRLIGQCCSLLLAVLVIGSGGCYASECVVLLHGLARSDASMAKLAKRLQSEGFTVVNVDYPSREQTIAELSELAVAKGIEQCRLQQSEPINFVTHSLGGILVRYYYSNHEPEQLHRVVMLGPPNQGSEVVDHLKNVPGFALLNGPAGQELGTDEASVPKKLGPVFFELGVIAGTESINLLLSSYLPNPDDGKVSVASTKVEGMCGFVSLPTSHPMMMKNKQVIDEVVSFLSHGYFQSEQAEPINCLHQNITSG